MRHRVPLPRLHTKNGAPVGRARRVFHGLSATGQCAVAASFVPDFDCSAAAAASSAS